ncbi:trans-sulfuration enzyme family protein [Sediminibacterium ginsengisoli]|uniref:Cystathionine beta-lyase/cystathionine gamma-synthase n=1 Tax=Sediminibacterium ginsengisoli TaxID=413434 RepID=A0A1T4JVJ0_9BACT|nr:aminotransferase class I/II-fold pyridoxal phosphate-dependent enzyme [Sediminibacterium ginsengisoli]SJZ34139.1 Cystathionine beta-lyase/cystathionine gamma-synthase [Sediminibacterium ginsengisoli]
MDLSFIINELGEERDDYFRAIAPPIVQTSNFAFKTVAEMRNAFSDEYSTWIYSRGMNPTVDILRKKLAALDGAEDCLVFNSGAAAIFAAVLANVKSGDHIVSVKEPYSWAQRMFEVILPRFGVTVTYVDGTETANFKNAIRPETTLIYLESPNSWSFALQDLSAVAALAKEKGITTVIDNSYCTPIYQRPVEMGIDLVLQSATKYIGGHSDTVAGVLCGSRAMIERIFNSEYMNIGSGIQPFNAWLLIRGLRTLPARLERITRTTDTVIAFLKEHERVERVLFPLDPSFPQYELARRQMEGGCGLLTFIIKAESCGTIERFCESLRHILMAVSWGGHESLIIPKCAGMPPEQFSSTIEMHRSLRLYTGLEDADYIISDLKRGFDAIAGLP